ncbi:SDR family oxidoreductase [Kribbella italica]|uniref:NAD(P)-dependent dehydrogenase (Short-subunit alcohol dehydrogenase family) n=1 Tax=Kribbella italica TaxID=1540520 RepID=A0A7W9JDK2_9ACTN|nr:SDR family oxidoreductase [Kribbella italica]MBB5840176.1 NAD(P)-dependent dehydrogenase (short-subunit alcohol dehydrogenase family) [Kribbella italica]
MNMYSGKSVVITGGSSGMGLATAQLLVDRGARVLITGRTEATLDAARHQLGGRVLTMVSDATSLPAIGELAERVQADFGVIDALFVNAGVARFEAFESMPEALYDELFTMNAKGPYFTVQKLAPLLREGGAVVLTTSVTNVLGAPALSAYAAAKAALRSMTRSFARELLPRKIRVNAISPGSIDTGVLERSMTADAADLARAQMTASNPMLRLGRPDEIAKAVAFLAFDATFTTGAELVVDGGESQL